MPVLHNNALCLCFMLRFIAACCDVPCTPQSLSATNVPTPHRCAAVPTAPLVMLVPLVRQVDTADRGFSFMKDGPLDMRMDPGAPLSAEGAVNSWSEAELGRVIKEYGEERHWRAIARRWAQLALRQGICGSMSKRACVDLPGAVGAAKARISTACSGCVPPQKQTHLPALVPHSGMSSLQRNAYCFTHAVDDVYTHTQTTHMHSHSRRIVEARETQAITTTQQLVRAIGSIGGGGAGARKSGRRGAGGGDAKYKHPATRTFQALRIAVNAELQSVAQVTGVVREASCGRFVCSADCAGWWRSQT